MVSLIMLFYIMYDKENPVIYLALALNSFCSLGFVPTAMSFAVELTFPAMAAQINASMMMGS